MSWALKVSKKKKKQPHKKGQGEEIISVNKCKDIMRASECLKNKYVTGQENIFHMQLL